MIFCDRCKQPADVLHPVGNELLCGLCYDRRPYQPPRLTSYGTLADLTRGGGSGRAPDLATSTAFT